MYTRSQVRHACYRAKNNTATEKNKIILQLVEPLMKHNHRWDNFSTEWDIIITRDKTIKIVKPETDYTKIHTALLKASLFNEMGKSFDELEESEYNIVSQVESLMLGNIMSWSNYNKVWGVEIDRVSNIIKTVMYNVKSNQIEVTPEMITASMKDADGAAFSSNKEGDNVLEMKPMNEAQKQAFEEFLKTKQNNG